MQLNNSAVLSETANFNDDSFVTVGKKTTQHQRSQGVARNEIGFTNSPLERCFLDSFIYFWRQTHLKVAQKAREQREAEKPLWKKLLQKKKKLKAFKEVAIPQGDKGGYEIHTDGTHTIFERITSRGVKAAFKYKDSDFEDAHAALKGVDAPKWERAALKVPFLFLDKLRELQGKNGGTIELTKRELVELGVFPNKFLSSTPLFNALQKALQNVEFSFDATGRIKKSKAKARQITRCDFVRLFESIEIERGKIIFNIKKQPAFSLFYTNNKRVKIHKAAFKELTLRQFCGLVFLASVQNDPRHQTASVSEFLAVGGYSTKATAQNNATALFGRIEKDLKEIQRFLPRDVLLEKGWMTYKELFNKGRFRFIEKSYGNFDVIPLDAYKTSFNAKTRPQTPQNAPKATIKVEETPQSIQQKELERRLEILERENEKLRKEIEEVKEFKEIARAVLKRDVKEKDLKMLRKNTPPDFYENTNAFFEYRMVHEALERRKRTDTSQINSKRPPGFSTNSTVDNEFIEGVGNGKNN